MVIKEKLPATLLLADGTIFNGFAAGKIGTTIGEICFNTGTTGYEEIFTDPSYFGQIMVNTHTHIGNYGSTIGERESNKVQIAGLVVRNYASVSNRKLANSTLDSFLIDERVVCIQDIDTRALVRHIRQAGAMNAIISSEIFDYDVLRKSLLECKPMAGLSLASKVSTKAVYTLGNAFSLKRVAVLDYGIKRNILQCLVDRDCFVQIFPHNSSIAEVLSFSPNGILLSNGPGDPSAMEKELNVVKGLMETKIPVFGICLGNQLIGRAVGVDTIKMHHGHRGINHAVKNIATGRCEITSQNHGFVLDAVSLKSNKFAEITHVNLNDGTVEGIRLKDKPIFAVQFHPESAPGPHDSRYLFDDFLKTIKV